MEQTWAAPRLSTSQMASEQQASASLKEWSQWAFASLMDSSFSDSFCQRVIWKLETSFHQQASIKDLVNSRSPMALVASSWRWATSKAGASLLGYGVPAVGEEVAGISCREGSSISTSSGALTWDDISTGLARSSHLGGRGVTRTMGSSLFGVELPDVCPEVFSAAQDRSCLASIVMLTCPSALGGWALMGLVVGMGLEWPPKGGTLGSCPFQWIARCPLVGGWFAPKQGCTFG